MSQVNSETEQLLDPKDLNKDRYLSVASMLHISMYTIFLVYLHKVSEPECDSAYTIIVTALSCAICVDILLLIGIILRICYGNLKNAILACIIIGCAGLIIYIVIIVVKLWDQFDEQWLCNDWADGFFHLLVVGSYVVVWMTSIAVVICMIMAICGIPLVIKH